MTEAVAVRAMAPVDRLVNAVRARIEAALPWYSVARAEHESRRTEIVAAATERAVKRAGELPDPIRDGALAGQRRLLERR